MKCGILSPIDSSVDAPFRLPELVGCYSGVQELSSSQRYTSQNTPQGFYTTDRGALRELTF